MKLINTCTCNKEICEIKCVSFVRIRIHICMDTHMKERERERERERETARY